mgnify:CR=1 FL=1
MNIFLYTILFIIGAFCGSFAELTAYRLPLKISWKKRAFCEKCNKKLTIYDQIPILSYIFLNGKCNYCKNKIDKSKIIVEIIEQLKEKNCEVIFVYCNSLSSVVDFDRLAEKMNISIITPMQMYRNLGLEYKYLAVMAANSHGLTGVENNLYVSNPRLRVLGLSMLELVKAIEEGNKPEQIVEDFNFKTLFNYFELTNVEAVVLGCTHFPYIKKELEKITKLHILDVGVFMIESLKRKDI